MSDDLETVEDTKKGPVAEVTDDSCTVEFTEIVPLDRAFDDVSSQSSGFLDRVVEVKPGDLQVVKQEPAHESDSEGLNYFVKQEPTDECETAEPSFLIQVSSTSSYSTSFSLAIMM